MPRTGAATAHEQPDVPAYAKINLTLDVGARRADGYHEIRSVMQTIGLHDTLTVTRTPDRLACGWK